MTRTMYDSVTAADIPSTAKMVAGYVDGLYKWSDADWQRFRNAVLVRITVTGATLDADVADVESGDLTPDNGGAWVKQMLDAGRHPTLYYSASQNAAIDAAVAAHGVGPDAGWQKWTANWTGTAPAEPYGVAEQYANPTYSGGHYDLSVVRDYWPGVDPAPPSPTPAPPPVPAPVPTPTPAPAPPLDQARAAWARLGDLLVNAFPGAIIQIEAAVAKLNKLP